MSTLPHVAEIMRCVALILSVPDAESDIVLAERLSGFSNNILSYRCPAVSLCSEVGGESTCESGDVELGAMDM